MIVKTKYLYRETIIAENFETYPNVLYIDTEGLDFNLLAHLDFEKLEII